MPAEYVPTDAIVANGRTHVFRKNGEIGQNCDGQFGVIPVNAAKNCPIFRVCYWTWWRGPKLSGKFEVFDEIAGDGEFGGGYDALPFGGPRKGGVG
jgi:hypothetical protein